MSIVFYNLAIYIDYLRLLFQGRALIGPSFVREFHYLDWLFPMRSRYVTRTVAEFGMILHAFALGVQIDIGLV